MHLEAEAFVEGDGLQGTAQLHAAARRHPRQLRLQQLRADALPKSRGRIGLDRGSSEVSLPRVPSMRADPQETDET